MVQFFQSSADPRDAAYGQLASALGQGLGEGINNYYMNKALDDVLNDKSLSDAPISAKMGKLESALRPYGEKGQQAFQQRMIVEQQAQQEKQQKIDQEKGDILRRRLSGEPISEKEKKLFTPQEELAIAKHQQAIQLQELRNKGKAPAGGLGGQPVPPQQSQTIQKIVSENPDASANDLQLKFDEANVNPYYSKPYVDNQREKDKVSQKSFSQERAFQTGYSKDAVKAANQLRESIPKKENALNFSRNAVETGDVSYFSPDKLADATGIDLFRTSKGAQLVTAGKENLLSNMSKVSAKAQNIWFEQRLNSMFPKIGQSPEANLTVQEMIEGEVSMDKAYLKEFDRIAKEDNENYGYERKDIEQRARDAVKPMEKHIMERTSFRMKQIEEQEKGSNKMKEEVGKPVSKGTPLTLAMAKLYSEKFGDKALEVAEKNGYRIPSIEEFKSYQMTPQEHRETL